MRKTIILAGLGGFVVPFLMGSIFGGNGGSGNANFAGSSGQNGYTKMWDNTAGKFQYVWVNNGTLKVQDSQP